MPYGVECCLSRLTIAESSHALCPCFANRALTGTRASDEIDAWPKGAARPISARMLLRLRPGSIPLRKARVARFERLLGAADPEPLYFCPDVEDVAGGGKEGCILAGLYGAESVGHAMKLRMDE